MKLYHIHKSNSYDDLYEVGNSFTVGINSNNLRKEFLKESCSFVDKVDVHDNRQYIYHKDLTSLLEIDKINNMSSEEKYKTLMLIKEYIFNSKLNFRELILEEIRFKCFSDLPSRYKCMWLTDEDSLDTWCNLLKYDDKSKIFEVEVDGNIFVSSDDLLPRTDIPYEMMYQEAIHYWNPTKKDLEGIKDKEYLLEGNVKILRRVK